MIIDHRCAYGSRCRNKTELDGLKVGAVIEAQRGLCPRCFGTVRNAIRSISSDWAKLDAAVGDQGVTGEVHVSGTKDPPMPLNGTVLALRSTLSEWCEAALWMVAEPLGIDVRERHKAKGWPVKDGPVIGQASTILPENLKLLLDAPSQAVSLWRGGGFAQEDMDGIDVAMKLTEIHQECNRVLGETNPRLRLSMPCPVADCGAPTLGIDNGSTDVNCASCGGSWAQDQYDWLARLLISDEQEKDSEMLKYLLAEAQWKIEQLTRLASIKPEQLVGIDAVAMAEVMKEILVGES